METSQELFTPERARETLEFSQKNFLNRPINMGKSAYSVREYARAMRAGEWNSKNGESIKFDARGVLIDGYHRLNAVIMAGVPVKFLCIRGLETNAFETIDTGHIRTQADMLFTSGLCKKHMHAVAAAARRMLLFQRTGETGNKHQTFFSLNEIRATLAAHPLIIEGAKEYHSNRCILSQSNFILFFCLTQEIDEDKGKAFMQGVIQGDGMDRNDARYVLRELLISLRISMKARIIDPLYEGALTIKAWNSFYTGKPIRQLKWAKNETFPQLCGFGGSNAII